MSEFDDLVNMAPGELEDFLETDESKAVGQKKGGSGESTGHAEGRKIVEIERKGKDDLTDADEEHMEKVVGYIKRHLAQGGPKDDAEHSKWRYSLMTSTRPPATTP